VAAARSVRHRAYGRALRQLRTDRRLSQEALAHLANLDRTYVSGIERGERNPSLENILRLADALQIKVSELAILAEAIETYWRRHMPR
jgi:transcriptional regulator with XRE-family HTH domain